MFRDDACIIDLLAFDWENDPQNDILLPEAARKGPPQSHNQRTVPSVLGEPKKWVKLGSLENYREIRFWGMKVDVCQHQLTVVL